MKRKENEQIWIWVGLIILATAIAYSNSFENGFVAWDDDAHVYENQVIRNIDGTAIRAFFTKYYVGMYAPVTMISYAVDYKIGRLDPAAYHRTNFILHLLNVALVFYFLYRLTGQKIIAAISALFFGIHPLHVESVAWVSARKDMLYAFFYLGGLIAWTGYRDTKNPRACYFLTIVLFLLSLLSKSAAVTFPMILILIDYYITAVRKGQPYSQDYTWKAAMKFHMNTIPFFLMSMAFGILSLFSQRVIGTDVDYVTGYTVLDRVFLGAYAFTFYLVESVVPRGLSALHTMPMKPEGMLPVAYYLSIIVPIIFAVLLIKLFRRGTGPWKDVLFGMLFFFFTVALILFIPVGQAVVAERYTYLPYIGLFMVIGACYLRLGGMWDSPAPRAWRFGLTTIVIATAVLFSGITFARNRVWKDSMTLFTDVIEKNPDAASAYNNRGNFRMEQKDLKGAGEDFDKAIALNYFDAYTNRGILRNEFGDYQNALEDFNQAAALPKTDHAKVLYNRGIVRLNMGDFSGAEDDFSGAIRINPQYADAWNSRGILRNKFGDYQNALEDFNRAAALPKTDPSKVLYNRGTVRLNMGNFSGAEDDFSGAIRINPQYADAWNSRGVVRYEKLSDFSGAVRDFDEAIRLDPVNSYAYYNRGNLQLLTGKISEALADYNRAIDLAPQFTGAYFNKGLALLQSGNLDGACLSWSKVAKSGETSVEELKVKYCQDRDRE